jgi:parallel beta-helix repeat protein
MPTRNVAPYTLGGAFDMTSKLGSGKLLFASILLLAFGSQFAAAKTLCVNPGGTKGCYSTIGAAVTAATAGSTIKVAAGTYKEDVVIPKSLYLIGAGSKTTIVDATGLSNAFYVDGLDNPKLSTVTIQGFTAENANFEGIYATAVSGLNVYNNLVTNNDLSLDTKNSTCPGLPAWETSEGLDCGEGIHIDGTSYSTVANNVSEGNAGGILVADDTGKSEYNVISGNTFKDNLYDCGMTQPSHPPYQSARKGVPWGIYYNTFYKNTSTGNGTALPGAGSGILLAGFVPSAIVEGTQIINNTLTNNGLPGVVFHGHSNGGTPGVNLENTVVTGNTISGNGADTGDAETPGTTGINVFGAAATSTAAAANLTGVQIYGNTITNEAYAIVANNSDKTVAHLNNLDNTGKVGLDNLGKGTVDATQNYWGCAAGPTNSACSSVSGKATVDPFLTAKE